MQCLVFGLPGEVFKDFPRRCLTMETNSLAVEEEGRAVDERPGQILNADCP